MVQSASSEQVVEFNPKNKRVNSLTERFLDEFVWYAETFKAGSGALHTIWAAKVAPGCIALYSNSGDKRFLSLAEPVIDAVISSQHPDGYWVKNGRPWVIVSAEQCYWLTDIAGRL